MDYREKYQSLFLLTRQTFDGLIPSKKSNLMKNSNRIFVMETNKHRINEIFSSTCNNRTITNIFVNAHFVTHKSRN